MDDLKAKAIAIGEELLQKGEKLLNELKHGKSDNQQNAEQGSDDAKKAKADHTSQDKSSNKSDKQNAKDGQTDYPSFYSSYQLPSVSAQRT